MKPALSALALSSILILSFPVAAQVRDHQRINLAGNGSVSTNSQEGLAVATRGNRWIVAWPEQNGVSEGRQDIYVAISDNDGLTFGPMARVDLGDGPNATDSDEPKCEILSDGTLVVAWEEKRDSFAAFSSNDDYFYNRSVDGGATWMPMALPINSSTAGSNTATDVDFTQLTSSGTSVYACWTEESPAAGLGSATRLMFAKSDDSAATWTTPVALNALVPGHSNGFFVHNAATRPRMVAEGQKVAIVFVDDRVQVSGVNQTDVFVLISDDGGATWSEVAVESGLIGEVADPQIARDGDLVCVTWQDSDPANPALWSARAAVSQDGGLTFAPEQAISTLADTVPGASAFTIDPAVAGQNIYVAYVHDAVFVGAGLPGGQAGSKAHVAVSNDSGATFATDIPLDQTSGLRSNRTVVEAHGEFAAIHFEMGVNGSNRVAYSFTSDSGATWAEGVTVASSGPDSDTETTYGGPWFHFNPVTHVGLSLYWDRSNQNWNEVYAAAVRLPALVVTQGVTAQFNNRYTLTNGVPIGLGVRGIPVSEGPSSTFLIGVSLSGFSPSAQVGPLQIHLVPDSLTLSLLTSPLALVFLSGGVDATGSGDALPFPWPFLPGSPDLTVIGIVQGLTGAITYVTDPLTLVTL